MSLARNVGLSGAANVEVLPTALGAEVGYAPLFTTVSDVLTSLDESRVPDAIKLIVPVTTLDAVVVERKVEGVNLVKVDAEGWELPVFRGASATLARDRPTIVFEALADSPAAELASFFEALRYEIFAVAERRLEKIALASMRATPSSATSWPWRPSVGPACSTPPSRGRRDRWRRRAAARQRRDPDVPPHAAAARPAREPHARDARGGLRGRPLG